MGLIVEPLLGTRVEVALESDADGDVAEQAVVDEVVRLESVFSVFDESSALCRLRRGDASDSADLNSVVALAGEWHELSGGAFDPRSQSVIDLWDRAESEGVVPSDAELDQACRSSEAADLNLNAIAKGWIADHALRLVVAGAPRVSSGWLSLGGDLVHVGEGSVVVGIENPHRPYDNVPPMARIEVAGEALATSGGARRWWSIAGQRFSKVLDPRTGRPVDHVAGATVVAADGATADVLATIALVLQIDETLELVEEVGAHCFLVDRNGTVVSSSDRFIQA